MPTLKTSIFVCFLVLLGKQKEDMSLDELDELEDEEEERVLEQYRRQRMAEIRAKQAKALFGDIREISAEDYVREVNQAGEGVAVVLHLYKQGIPLCALLNQQMTELAGKFPDVKFLRAISTTCIPNYPDRNLPTVFYYRNGDLKGQLAGPLEFRGMSMTRDELEFMLGKLGAIDNTDIKEDPRPKVNDVMLAKLKNDADSDDDDW